MSIAFLFATEQEAQGTIELLKAKQIDKANFLFAQGMIVITGMGLLKSSQTALMLPKQINRACNLGITGALNDAFEPCSIHTISEVGFYLPLPGKLSKRCISLAQMGYPKLQLSPCKAACDKRLVSSNFPIHDEKLRDELNLFYDFVDMEGYGIASSLKRRRIPFDMIKLVSDFAKQTTKHDIMKNLPIYSKLLGKEAEKLIGYNQGYKPRKSHCEAYVSTQVNT